MRHAVEEYEVTCRIFRGRFVEWELVCRFLCRKSGGTIERLSRACNVTTCQPSYELELKDEGRLVSESWPR